VSAENAEIGIRDLTDADLPDVVTMVNEQIATSPFVYAEIPITTDDRLAWLNEHREAGLPTLAAVAANEQTPIFGWAALSPYRMSSGYRFTAEVSVYVAPGAQRRGIATRLLHELLSRAPALRLHVLIASIDSNNAPSIALFERFGFIERGRLPDVGRKFGEWHTQLLFQRQVG
jgi:phosphinothricin acetyltransferase